MKSLEPIRPRSRSNITVILGTIIVLQLLIISLLLLRSHRIEQRLEATLISNNPIYQSPTPTASIVDYSTWRLYTNDRLGFSLKYPSDIGLTPKEIDIKAAYLKYIEECEASNLGCGSGRWPDFVISFLKPNDRVAFAVYIHQIPVSRYFGGAEHDGFTYIIDADEYVRGYDDIKQEPINNDILINISKTLEFHKPDKPLSCLWDRNTAPGFDPIKDKNYINENSNKLSEVFGYSFNDLNKNCIKNVYYTWQGQEETDKPPFDTMESCISNCSR